jgi:hypothetical protein
MLGRGDAVRTVDAMSAFPAFPHAPSAQATVARPQIQIAADCQALVRVLIGGVLLEDC